MELRCDGGAGLATIHTKTARDSVVMGICEDRHIQYAISAWLRHKRRSLDLYQKDICAELGVNKVAVHLWETGAQSPGTLARWKAWARAVNCRLEITVVDEKGERHEF